MENFVGNYPKSSEKPMFEASYTEGILFKKLIDILHNITKIFCIRVTPEGIFSQMLYTRDGVDKIMLDIRFPKSCFHTFTAESDFFFGINILHLHRVISSIRKKDTLVLKVYENSPRQLFISVVPKDQDYHETNSLTMYDIQNIEMELPQGYTTPVRGPAQKFHKLCKEMDLIGREVFITGNDRSVRFQGALRGMYGKQIVFGDPNPEDNESSPAADLRGIFEVENLKKISKIAAFNPTLLFFCTPGLPLLIQTKINDQATLSIYIKSREMEAEVHNGN